MASNFLENLKKAVNDGEFNSEAAKKILEINKLASIIAPTGGAMANIEKRIIESGGFAKPVSEEEAIKLNLEYEKKIEKMKKIEFINAKLAELIEIEEMICAGIQNMFSFCDELETKFEKEFENEDPMYSELSQKIDEITSKYTSIINN